MFSWVTRSNWEGEFRALRSATKGLSALWTSDQLGSAGPAFAGVLDIIDLECTLLEDK